MADSPQLIGAKLILVKNDFMDIRIKLIIENNSENPFYLHEKNYCPSEFLRGNLFVFYKTEKGKINNYEPLYLGAEDLYSFSDRKKENFILIKKNDKITCEITISDFYDLTVMGYYRMKFFSINPAMPFTLMQPIKIESNYINFSVEPLANP